eukprot:2416113-Pleurochrysis_carterae.AAC.1
MHAWLFLAYASNACIREQASVRSLTRPFAHPFACTRATRNRACANASETSAALASPCAAAAAAFLDALLPPTNGDLPAWVVVADSDAHPPPEQLTRPIDEPDESVRARPQYARARARG